MRAVSLVSPKKKSTWQHAVRLVLALLLVLCFLMPMFQIGAWKNVSLKTVCRAMAFPCRAL